MRTALKSGDPATAERAAHSLKGAAGALGAVALAEAAAVTERSIKNSGLTDQILQGLSFTLDQVVDNIRAALPEENNSLHRAADNPAAFEEALARLKQLLENDDGEAADALADAKSSLVGVLTPSEMNTLSKRIDDFDFEAALECLASIGSRLSISLDGE